MVKVKVNLVMPEAPSQVEVVDPIFSVFHRPRELVDRDLIQTHLTAAASSSYIPLHDKPCQLHCLIVFL